MRWTIAMVSVAALTIAGSAQAFDERAWLFVGGGGAKYAMTDLNEEVKAFNQTNSGSGLAFATIDKGPGFSIEAGYETTARWNFGIGYDRLLAETSASDATDKIRYDFTTNAVRAFAEYSIRPMGSNSIHLGAGFGWIGESGKVTLTSSGSPPSEEALRGTGPLYDGYAGANLWITQTFGLSGTAGYRYAKFARIHTESGYEYDSQIDGSPVQIDFSGPYVRLGFKLASNPEN